VGPAQLLNSHHVIAPAEIQIIGSELAIRWVDGTETFIPIPKLRAASPSAEVQGERDIFGRRYGGEAGAGRPDVDLLGWTPIGNYAIRFRFSDGHQTGLYTYDYLRELGEGKATL
jgi:DUF971 family protein